MNIGEAVRERIIELCRENDISINKLCTMSGVTQSTVNNIVSGRNNSATVSTIKKLCDGLGISIEDFFHSVKLHPEAKLFHFNVNSIDRSCSGIWNRKSNNE